MQAGLVPTKRLNKKYMDERILRELSFPNEQAGNRKAALVFFIIIYKDCKIVFLIYN